MLPENHKKCAVGEAAIRLIGSVAGFGLSKPDPDFGIDFDVKKYITRPWHDGKTRHVEAGLVCQIQLKSSGDFEEIDGFIMYDLEAKSYDDMVGRNIDGEMPIILVLMALNKSALSSVIVRGEEIAICKSLYWYRVESKDQSPNKVSVRVKIPSSQKLDVSTFTDLMKSLHA